ncbi:hypothetical protein PPERSA_07002 [Pseudocohnilembus persalinus]|uniref:Uncharacterized protein n=1 Tax=Pseudocohnilembus persalinus TaxID=266149 RepID=A0A0V0QYN8_PSEPJ|nr:hypothetical protein PPERSA_07002 [Pseudocohnilembus persalinus]|eukprot:KRX07387.1 hypothetical protein PPERSA_07002 [Pseudocohnilembus persalinus]
MHRKQLNIIRETIEDTKIIFTNRLLFDQSDNNFIKYLLQEQKELQKDKMLLDMNDLFQKSFDNFTYDKQIFALQNGLFYMGVLIRFTNQLEQFLNGFTSSSDPDKNSNYWQSEINSDLQLDTEQYHLIESSKLQ